MNNTVQIDRALAAKILSIVDHGLSSGLGEQAEGKMCVEAAVCYAMGLPHGDEPPCVAPVVRSLKITLNDAAWSSNKARAKGMRRLAIAQLGTAGEIDEQEFAKSISKVAIQKIVPRALRNAAKCNPSKEHQEALEKSATNCEKDGTPESARSAAESAESAKSAAESAEAAAWSVVWAAESARSVDAELSFFAECVVQVLIEMKAKGTEWLDLTEAA